ncbi:hypothetical protein FRC15_002606 [Serendipita sp. 397]|nr:hypothetical protein FRC15_002606 [Serendipita sp. 397]
MDDDVIDNDGLEEPQAKENEKSIEEEEVAGQSRTEKLVRMVMWRRTRLHYFSSMTVDTAAIYKVVTDFYTSIRR